ncbi:MAG: hypothetical protein KDD44_01915 [Bdellovibrionales bacterium]|nr:hypothetical protein [Bdellovibrionales bacterium]
MNAALHPLSRSDLYRAAFVFAVAFAAALAQVAWVAHPLDHVYSDMQGYVERGYHLTLGEPLGAFDVFFPPGTQYVFSVFFTVLGFTDGINVLTVAQMFWLAGAAACCTLTAIVLFGHRRAATIAGLVMAFYWPLVTMASFYASEALFVFLAMVGQCAAIIAVQQRWRAASWYLLGLFAGIMVLVKGQGLAFAFGTFIFLLLMFPRVSPKAISSWLVGFCVPVLLQMVIVSTVLKKPTYTIATNDAFNMYLGQSNLMALGTLDPQTYAYYIFHNNNSHFNHHLSAPKSMLVAIGDRAVFRSATVDLWLEAPFRQFVRSLNSVTELWSSQLEWPPRNLTDIRGLNGTIKLWVLLLAFPAFLWTLSMAYRGVMPLPPIALMLLPLLGVSAMAFVSMGQPRYAAPFFYNLIILAIPAYQAAVNALGQRMTRVGKRVEESR